MIIEEKIIISALLFLVVAMCCGTRYEWPTRLAQAMGVLVAVTVLWLIWSERICKIWTISG